MTDLSASFSLAPDPKRPKFDIDVVTAHALEYATCSNCLETVETLKVPLLSIGCPCSRLFCARCIFGLWDEDQTPLDDQLFPPIVGRISASQITTIDQSWTNNDIGGKPACSFCCDPERPFLLFRPARAQTQWIETSGLNVAAPLHSHRRIKIPCLKCKDENCFWRLNLRANGLFHLFAPLACELTGNYQCSNCKKTIAPGEIQSHLTSTHYPFDDSEVYATFSLLSRLSPLKASSLSDEIAEVVVVPSSP